MKTYDFEGNLISEVDFSELIGADDYINQVTGDASGNIHILMFPNDAMGMQEMVVDRLGSIIEEKHDTFQNMSTSFTDTAENTYVISDGNEQTYTIGSEKSESGPQISVYDAKGSLVSSFPVELNIENEPQPQPQMGLCQIDDTIYISTNFDVYPIDLENETIGDPITYNNSWSVQPLFLKNGIYFDQPDGFYRFDLASQVNRKVISWNDLDIDLTR